MGQTGRTKGKIRENLGLLIDYLRKRYGNVDDEVERMLSNALDWTADDVQEQCEAAHTEALEAIHAINNLLWNTAALTEPFLAIKRLAEKAEIALDTIAPAISRPPTQGSASVSYPCGATASEGSPPNDCPIHGSDCIGGVRKLLKRMTEVATAQPPSLPPSKLDCSQAIASARRDEAKWWYDYFLGKPQSGKLGIERLQEARERLNGCVGE